jgi:sterol 3beta-glucosyltransferase
MLSRVTRPRTIVLLASGTRGDVQPYVALGVGLQRARYRAVVATHAPFRALVERHGLEFAELDGNPSEPMTRPGGQSALTFDGSLLRSARATLRYLREARPLYQRMLASAPSACRGADAIVFGLATLWGMHLAEALRVPGIGAFLQPFTRTRRFACPLLPVTLSLGGAYNLATYRVVEQAIWQSWRGVIQHWRRGILQLPPAPFVGLYRRLYSADALMLYGFSEHVLPRPDDWPPSHHITGYWFLEEAEAWTPPDDLLRFLEAGPVVYIGFGSPGMRWPREALRQIERALRGAGLRAVLALPTELAGSISSPDVYPVADVPHAWLFPRLQGVAHHGGAGTTAASLRAGLPTLVIPMAIDQFLWGRRVAALEAGPRPIPQRALTAEKLAAALTQMIQDAAMQSRAKILGEAIRGEDGIGSAVELIRAVRL